MRFPSGLSRWNHNWNATTLATTPMRFPSGLSRWNHNWNATTLATMPMRFPSGLPRWNHNWNATTLATMLMRFPSGSPRWNHNWLADGHAPANQSRLPPGRARRRALNDERKLLVACQFALHRGEPDGSEGGIRLPVAGTLPTGPVYGASHSEHHGARSTTVPARSTTVPVTRSTMKRSTTVPVTRSTMK